jgi:hypothetical protein
VSESDAALDLFLHWLRETYGRAFHLPSGGSSAAADQPDSLITARDGDFQLTAAVRTLLPSDDPAWESRRRMLEELIGDGLPARVALWVPAGANLPSEEPDVSEFAAAVRDSAIKLGPLERFYVPLPIKLFLRKNADTGGVVSVTGGLNSHWARFTERVHGSYDLDSAQLHRLPESEEHLEKLLDAVVAETEKLDVGQYGVIDTIDAWTLQKLPGEPGVTIIGVPFAVANEGGIAVRRNFRRILAGTGPLREAACDVRALVVLAYYARIEQEGATVAMRGFEPSLYSGIDYIALVADGVVKPLIEPARKTPPPTPAISETL